MDQLIIIANWKSYKNIDEALDWLEQIGSASLQKENKKIILCPSFPLLQIAKSFIETNNLNISLGAQDISQFDEGQFTGEVSGRVLKDFVAYCLIGHSERRDKLGETDEDVSQKVALALKYGLSPVVCVQNENTRVPEGVDIVAYEPTFAIGTGNPDTPENAEDIAKKIKEKSNVKYVIYGGSVNPEIVHSFTEKENISGVLVGSKSLDSVTFSGIINNS